MPLLRQRCQLAPGLDGPSAPPLHPTRHSSGQQAGPSGLTAGLLRALQLCLGPLVSPSQTHLFCPRLQRLHLFPSGGIRWSRDRVREHREKMSFQPQKTPQDSLYHYKVGTGASEPGGQSHVPSCWQASANKDRMTDSSGAPGALRGDIWPQHLGSSLYNWQHFSPYNICCPRPQACQPPRGRQHTRPNSSLSLLWPEVPYPGTTVEPDPASLSELAQMCHLGCGPHGCPHLKTEKDFTEHSPRTCRTETPGKVAAMSVLLHISLRRATVSPVTAQ